jgi:predicted HicB family RNase H-like nuclease
MAKAERKPLTFEEDRTPPTVAAVVRQPPSKAKEQRQQLGARVTTTTYRQLKARAALQGVTVAALVEQAISEFLANHPD